MGFWLFGGGKKKRASAIEEKSRGFASENDTTVLMARNEKAGLRDADKLRDTHSREQPSRSSNRPQRAPITRSKDSNFATPPRSQAAPDGGAGSSRRQPGTTTESASNQDSARKITTSDAENVMYYQNPISNLSIGPERFDVVVTPTLRARHSDLNATLPRYKSSKRKAEDHAREREVRAMSSPIPIPRRGTTRSAGLLATESRNVPGNLNRHFERPMSEVSLPLPETLSEMTDLANQHSFKVNAFAVLSPRPTIHYDGNPRFTPTMRSQNQSRASTRPMIMEEEDFSSRRRIEDLADNLDASGLKELMDRDQRRRDRKRDADKAKLQRKLQRRADQQRDEEAWRVRSRDGRPYTPKDKGILTPSGAATGLGIDSDMGGSPTSAQARTRGEEAEAPLVSRDVLVGRERPRGDDEDPFADPKRPEKTREPPPPQIEHLDKPITDPFAHAGDHEPEQAQEPVINRFTSGEDGEPGPSVLPTEDIPPQQVDLQAFLPVRSPLRTVRAEQQPLGGTLSPSTSPPQAATDRGSLSQAPPPAVDTAAVSEAERRASDQSGAAASSWTTFFRRGGRRKRSSIDRGRSTPSDFSNTSRESFSRQQLPPLVPPRSYRRSGSGTPQRTRSKFREDLPELPISPPDSRVQSPDISQVHHATTVSQSESSQPGQAGGAGDGKSLATSSSLPTLEQSGLDDQSSQQRSLEMPPSERPPSTTVLAQSLASVDSEGSWLSGRPAKRSSGQMGHILRQSQSSLSREPAAGPEETDVADDEYFHRLTPAPEEPRRSSSGSAICRASSTVINLGGDGQQSPEPELPPLPDQSDETWHGSVGRQATIVRQTSRAKSKEGLLNDYQADELEASSPDEEGEGELTDFDTRAEELQTPPVMRARSVEYQGHARHISAGSAKLLDIRRSSGQIESTSPSAKPERTEISRGEGSG